MSDFYVDFALSPGIAAEMSQQQIMDEVATGKAPNERAVLFVLTQLVLTQSAIHPDFQALANAVIANAFLIEKLPDKTDGRRRGSGRLNAEEVAVKFFNAVDSAEDRGEGLSNSEVIEKIAEDHHADVSTIRKLIKEAEPWLPNCKEGRDQLRRDAPLGLPWDHRNRRYAAQVKASSDGPPTICGRSIPDAIELAQQQIAQAAKKIGGKN